MILLLSTSHDAHLKKVQHVLNARSATYAVLDTSAIHTQPHGAAITFTSSNGGMDDHAVAKSVKEADKIWYRRPRPPFYDESTILQSYKRD